MHGATINEVKVYTYEENKIVMIGWCMCVIGISISELRLRDLHLVAGNYFRLISAVVFHELSIYLMAGVTVFIIRVCCRFVLVVIK